MSKMVRFVFYKAKLEWRNVLPGRKIRLIDDLVALGTWLPNLFTPWYSHVEVWIADEDGNGKFIRCIVPGGTNQGGSHVSWCFDGTCYTSTMRGDANGTVSRPASEVFTNPKRWEYLEFEVTDESFEVAKTWADERVAGKHKYSMKDIRRFFMPLWMLRKLKWDDPEREICSEHGEGWAVRLWRRYLEPCVGIRRMLMKILIRSPRRLWRDLVRRHHVPTYSLATGKMVRDEKGRKVK